MTLGASDATDINFAAQLSEVEDRAMLAAMSRGFTASPSFDITHSVDPSDGVNYSGGSSYSPGLPLLPSNAGLAGHSGGIREASFGAMTYGEAMNWSPAPLTKRISAQKAGEGRRYIRAGVLGAYDGDASSLDDLAGGGMDSLVAMIFAAFGLAGYVGYRVSGRKPIGAILGLAAGPALLFLKNKMRQPIADHPIPKPVYPNRPPVVQRII